MTRTRVMILALLLGTVLTADAVDAQAARQSWTSDRMIFAPGDMITVLIDEYTLAASNQDDFNSDRRFSDLGAGVSATGGLSGAADVSTSNQAESRSSGEATRQNRFQGEMTVRVVAIEDGGLLRVEGRKVVNIDETSEELLLRGVVRPQDVSPHNVVDSWRVGEAELVYTTDTPSPRGSIIGRILGAIWP
ncbi:MAG: flagellar basal body L-ring protein FlgH [Gemmatimonadota bacterium]